MSTQTTIYLYQVDLLSKTDQGFRPAVLEKPLCICTWQYMQSPTM